MVDRTLITAAVVAAKLRHPTVWFYRNRKMLESKYGFPTKISGCGNRWDPAAIDRWLDSQMPEDLRNEDEKRKDEADAMDVRLAKRGALIVGRASPGDKKGDA